MSAATETGPRTAPAAGPNWLTVWLLAGFAVAACLRMPQIVLKGRFWAEEGSVFFARAWNGPALPALLFSFAGYLNLAANAATLAAARLMPLAWAPYLTIAVSLLVQLCAPLLLLTARDAWLSPARVRVAAVLLLLLVPAAEEVWLQTLCCQFQLVLSCGIVLALEPASGRRTWFRLALLLLAPLCGPVAITLLPLFLLRAAVDRAAPRLLQSAALLAGATIQLLFFFHPVPGRGYSLHPVPLLVALTMRHLDIPFLGTGFADSMAPLIQARLAAGHIPLKATLLPVLVFVPFLLATLWRRSSRPAFWLLASGGVVACGSYFGAIGGVATMMLSRGNDRYTFAPQALLALAVLALAATAPRRISLACWMAVLWLLAMGGWNFTHPWALVADGPAYRPQIAAWRADPAHRILIWPGGLGCTMGLAPAR